jgi:SAM-dependent methyltransferase
MNQEKKVVKEFIIKKYSDVASQHSLGSSEDSEIIEIIPLNIISSSLNIGYSESDLGNIPISSNMGLGCGNPIIAANLKEGEVVLDLGSGGGIDCFLARRKVGESGYVIGVDMTSQMIQLAQQNKEKSNYTNIDFRLGEIEHLPVEDNSIDVIISNCVVNLSLNKLQVFKDAFRVLKSKGRICISDILATAELPEEVKNNLASLAGCVAGAEFVGNIRKMLITAGFRDIQLTPKDNSRQILETWAPTSDLSDFVASYLIEAKKD